SSPRLVSWYSLPPLPPGLSSTTLIAEDPMSTPTSPLLLPKSATPAPLFTDGGYPRSRVPDAPPTGPPKRIIRGDTNLQKIVKVLAEASRGVPLCQAENEAPASKSWRRLHSADCERRGREGSGQPMGRRGRRRPVSVHGARFERSASVGALTGPAGQKRILTSGSSLAWMVSMKRTWWGTVVITSVCVRKPSPKKRTPFRSAPSVTPA